MTTRKTKPKRATTPRQKPKPRRRPKRRVPSSGVSRPRRRQPQVAVGQVRLVEGKGSAGHGAEQGGHYWHVYVGEKRAGNVLINMLEHDLLGLHPSVQMFLNQDQRGRGIGRVAYRLACELSGYESVFAHMRKSNTASRRAAEIAGFVVVDGGSNQLSMIWRREPSVDEAPPT
jgi:hypothetical protein